MTECRKEMEEKDKIARWPRMTTLNKVNNKQGEKSREYKWDKEKIQRQILANRRQAKCD